MTVSQKRVTGDAKIRLKPFVAVFAACTLLLSFTDGSAASKKKDEKPAAQVETVQNNIHNPGEAVNDWQTALQYLKDGNKRFTENRTITRNTNAQDREILKDGQKPFAVVVTCSDSRVPPEIYFDQKLGDIFVIRNAGNIAEPAVLGSIEYAVEHLKTPLVVVVGHSRCGAVTGAFDSNEEHTLPENLQTIISAIKSAIDGCKSVDDAVHANVNNVVKRVKENKIVSQEKATVVGAYYNIESGEVSF
jgi:carbonic anhydrase